MIIYDGSVGTYVIDKSNFCTCPSFLFKGNCKHVEAVKNMKISELSSFRKKYTSSISTLNEKFDGYFYTNDGIVGIVGKPDMGKSLFSIQETYSFAKEVPCLFVDTEGGALTMFERWDSVFRKRFSPKKEIYFEQKKSLYSLHEFLGFKTNVIFKATDKSGTKGKLEFRVIETITKPEINTLIEKEGIKFVVIDSISSPIRQTFTDEQQNFPAKASAQALIFGKLLELQDKYGVGILVTLQASFNPADPYSTVDSISARGGIVVHHYTKRLFYMDRRDKKEYKDYRRLWFLRVENKPKLSDVIPLFIDDNGFHECNIEMKDILTDAEYRIVTGGGAVDDNGSIY